MGTKSLFLPAVCLILTVAQAPAQERHYRALVIGNGQYTVKPLAWPVANARAVAARLRELQYDVALYENTKNQRLTSALASFRQKISADDVVVLYYAGRVTRSRNVGALAPLDDTDPDIDLGVPLQTVLDTLERSRSAVNLVVFDVLAEWPVFGLDIGKEWLGALPQPTARTVIFSTGAPAARRSLTPELLEALKEPGRPVSEVVEELWRTAAPAEWSRPSSARWNMPISPGAERVSAPASPTRAQHPPDPAPAKPVSTRSVPVESAPALTRFPTMDAPPAVTTGQPFSVVVSLTTEKRTPDVKVPQLGPGVQATAEGALQLGVPCHPKCDVEVVLSAPGFDFSSGSNTVAIEMTADGDSTPARFSLRALEPGEGRLEATFWHRGAFLARAVRSIQVGSFGAAPSMRSSPPPMFAPVVTPAPAPDLRLRLRKCE